MGFSTHTTQGEISNACCGSVAIPIQYRGQWNVGQWWTWDAILIQCTMGKLKSGVKSYFSADFHLWNFAVYPNQGSRWDYTGVGFSRTPFQPSVSSRVSHLQHKLPTSLNSRLLVVLRMLVGRGIWKVETPKEMMQMLQNITRCVSVKMLIWRGAKHKARLL